MKAERTSYQIPDSYKVREYGDIRRNLERLKAKRPVPAPLYFRSLQSLENEWYAHNLLHDLQLFRSRTASVDFEYPQAWYVAAAYAVLAAFYRP